MTSRSNNASINNSDSERLLQQAVTVDKGQNSRGAPPRPSPSGNDNKPVLLIDSPLPPPEEALLDDVLTDSLEGAISIESLLVPPNVPPNVPDVAVALARIVNVHGSSAGISTLGTNVIDPGTIGIINCNGRVEIVPPGRWIVANPRARWIRNHSLNEGVITYESLSIVRVQKGCYSLAEDNGTFIVLAEGIHVRNSRLFRHLQFVDVNQKHIQHRTIHIIIVPVGEYALVFESNKPKILKTGRYVIDSNFFSVAGWANVNQQHIQHGSIHIVRVLKGKIACINNNLKPILLHEGTHTFNSQMLVYHGEHDVNEPHITHGTITRFRVRNGEIGLAWEDNRAVFVETAGVYEVDSPTFAFVKCIPASEKCIELGSRKRVVVYDGEVGISYLNGKLDILTPKIHLFDAAERVFVGFLSTKQQIAHLTDDIFDGKPASNSGKASKFLRCDTKDFVEIGVKAAVFYRITNPETALLTVGDTEAIEKLVTETSIATLQVIVRSTALNQVAQSKNINAVSQDMHSSSGSVHNGAPAPSAPLFFDMVHDEFISRLHDNFKSTYGVEIANIRVESFKLMNQELADNISKQAIITAQTESKLANLEGQRKIATAEMERDSAVIMIKAQAQAAQLATDVQAKNNAAIADAQSKAQAARIVATGDAEALLIRAEAEAKALSLKAEAEAKAIEIKASAEKKRAEEVGSTPLGTQLAVLGVTSEMVTKSMQGVQKIIYLPSNANMAASPMQLFGGMSMMGGGFPQMGFPMDALHSDASTSTSSTHTTETIQRK